MSRAACPRCGHPLGPPRRGTLAQTDGLTHPAGAPMVDLYPPPWWVHLEPRWPGERDRSIPEPGPPPSAPLDPLASIEIDPHVWVTAGVAIGYAYSVPRGIRWRVTRGRWARAYRATHARLAAERRRERCEARR